MLAKCFSLETPHEILRFQCVDALYKCYQELDDWVPSESPHRLGVLARQHLLLYSRLCAESAGDLVWNLFPKHHLFAHVAEGAVVNPRLEWNYGDEAEIGTAVGLAKATNLAYLPTHLLRRYCLVFELEA